MRGRHPGAQVARCVARAHGQAVEERIRSHFHAHNFRERPLAGRSKRCAPRGHGPGISRPGVKGGELHRVSTQKYALSSGSHILLHPSCRFFRVPSMRAPVTGLSMCIASDVRGRDPSIAPPPAREFERSWSRTAPEFCPPVAARPGWPDAEKGRSDMASDRSWTLPGPTCALGDSALDGAQVDAERKRRGERSTPKDGERGAG